MKTINLLKALLISVAAMAAPPAEETAKQQYLPITNVTPYVLTDSPLTLTTNMIRIADGKGEVLSIASDGRLTMGPGMTQDRASRVFWTNIANAFPFVKRHLVTQELGMDKEDLLTMLQQVSEHLQPSTGVLSDTLEYRSPAEQLRRQADAIERRDAVIARFRALIAKLEGKPSPTNP